MICYVQVVNKSRYRIWQFLSYEGRLSHLLAGLVVAVAVALLLVGGGALLLVLEVGDGLVDHGALLAVHHPALLLALGVVHGAALRLRELIALLPVPDILDIGHNIINICDEITY